MAKNKKYEEWLLEKLKDHDLAVDYLNAALTEARRRSGTPDPLYIIQESKRKNNDYFLCGALEFNLR